MRRFADMAVVVTGASKGIGSAIAERFLREGARVGIMDADVAAGQAYAQACASEGKPVFFAAADITDPGAVKAAAADLVGALGGLQVLVNCAGAVRGESLEETNDETWRWNVDVNLNGAFSVSRAVLPQLLTNKRSAIVNVSSVNALMTIGVPAYSAAKAGMLALTRSFATEYASRGLRANAVLPGTIRTSAWDDRIEKNPGVMEKMNAWYPGGAVGRPEDVAAAVAFLASEEAAFINGSSLVVDGGLTSGHHRMIQDFL
ncbi:SDR family NAD(P)-dependent oxidoreductase [Microbulbifer elongatus]|uniref:SDR family NAD(P)-dependent oxidoreductase n=1 Tax=Microbulbifer elongatus TaxID=86173 RepID=UPI001CFC74DB|nr:SDR family oxidoreductase [Microbulbifer elongatus]